MFRIARNSVIMAATLFSLVVTLPYVSGCHDDDCISNVDDVDNFGDIGNAFDSFFGDNCD